MPLEGPRPNIGDLIQFKGLRYPYNHWAVYVGRGEVVHLQAEKGDYSPLKLLGKTNVKTIFKNRARVEKAGLEEVADGRWYRVKNKYDKKTRPYLPEEIKKDALDFVGEEMYYNMITANCEHFATLLRYGKEYCEQVECLCDSEECEAAADEESEDAADENWSQRLLRMVYGIIQYPICFLKGKIWC